MIDTCTQTNNNTGKCIPEMEVVEGMPDETGLAKDTVFTALAVEISLPDPIVESLLATDTDVVRLVVDVISADCDEVLVLVVVGGGSSFALKNCCNLSSVAFLSMSMSSMVGVAPEESGAG